MATTHPANKRPEANLRATVAGRVDALEDVHVEQSQPQLPPGLDQDCQDAAYGQVSDQALQDALGRYNSCVEYNPSGCDSQLDALSSVCRSSDGYMECHVFENDYTKITGHVCVPNACKGQWDVKSVVPAGVSVSSCGLGTGAIIGLAVGGVALVVVLVLCVFFLRSRKTSTSLAT